MGIDKSRYIAEIEIPDGYISIDCEVDLIDQEKPRLQINFYLNSSSLNIQSTEEYEGKPLRKELENELQAVRVTDVKNVREYIEGILRVEYGEQADIQLSEIEFD